MKRKYYKRDPRLIVHRYVVEVYRETEASKDTYYHYAKLMKDARKWITSFKKPGDIVLIFKAKHIFKEAWEI